MDYDRAINWMMAFLFISFVSLSCKKRELSTNDNEINATVQKSVLEASAEEFLKDDKFTSLKIEIQYMEGFQPNKTAIANLKSFLIDHLHKRNGIIISQQKIKSSVDTVLSWQNTQQIIDENRTVFSNERQLAMYILYTNGEANNGQILGQVFGNTAIVFFGKAIKAGSSEFSFPSQTTVETSLLLHEMGHVLGLVDKGSPMQVQHADSLHEAHCKNPDCIMFWDTNINRKYGPFNRVPVSKFDSACLKDLKANGGK